MYATARLTQKPPISAPSYEFTTSEMEMLDKISTIRTFEKKHYIYYPQEPSKNIFFLKEGRVKIGTYSNEGKEVIKSIIYPGQLFGELGLIGEEKRSDFAKSLNENVRVAIINIDDMRELMLSDMHLNLKAMTQIGNRLRKVERRLESLIFKSARSRIVDLLKDMAHERGLKVGYEVLLRQFFSHREIAAMTGTSRQTVTKVLSDLKRSNLIHTDRKNILIRDMINLT
jgi:CRP/FNR family transcriptional regulator, cyclic AMP receptor protein